MGARICTRGDNTRRQFVVYHLLRGSDAKHSSRGTEKMRALFYASGEYIANEATSTGADGREEGERKKK